MLITLIILLLLLCFPFEMFNHHCMAGYPVGFYYQNRFPMPAYIVYCIVHVIKSIKVIKIYSTFRMMFNAPFWSALMSLPVEERKSPLLVLLPRYCSCLPIGSRASASYQLHVISIYRFIPRPPICRLCHNFFQ